MKSYLYFSYTLLLSALFFSCNQSAPGTGRPTFKDVEGIKFIEVRREFDTGFSFSEEGFQQVPEWTLYFIPGDSIKIYSPVDKKYIFYPIYFDHGEVMNLARKWLRLKHVSKDSLIFQLLKVESKVVNKNLSTVYMRFYSEDYIRNVLHANPDRMKEPTKRDTLFIRKLVNRANSYPNKADSVFSARTPVVMQSIAKSVSVKKKVFDKNAIDYSAADEYLYPEYDIVIHKAYKNFAYNFTALVDTAGNITVNKFAVIEKDFEAPQRKVMQGIADVYFKNYLKITPGHTLGMPHTTEIILHVKGFKD